MAMSQAEMVQKARVRALSEGLQVYRVAGTTDAYVVPSKSAPGEAYEVLMVNGEPTCSCEGAVNRGVCKHQELVRMRYAVDAVEVTTSE